MRPKTKEKIPPRVLLAYLEGEVTRSEAAEIEAQLADSRAARRRLEGLQDMLAALARPDEAIQGIDLVSGVRQAIASGMTRPEPRSGFTWRLALAAGVACLAVSLPLWLAHERQRRAAATAEEEFRPKLAAPGGPQQDRWCGIQVFRVGSDGVPRPVDRRVGAGDGLLFSYTNLGPRPFAFLMVFAVDARQEVRWFHPAYEREGTDPMSISIARGRASVELPELVHHELSPGPVALYGIFSHRPLRVLEIEALIQKLGYQGKWAAKGAPRLPLPGVAQQIQVLGVER